MKYIIVPLLRIVLLSLNYIVMRAIFLPYFLLYIIWTFKFKDAINAFNKTEFYKHTSLFVEGNGEIKLLWEWKYESFEDMLKNRKVYNDNLPEAAFEKTEECTASAE